ncbi:MAG TPA: hypothetical protein VH111_09020 [Steroidobacteraceae bacterium]|nr:hypothetical protein [Steroidobacteraceae bacterium]
MKKLIAAAVSSLGFLIAGCSGGTGVIGATNLNMLNGNPGGSTPPGGPTGSTALFKLSTGQLPYPTDLYFAGSTDGTLNIQPPNALWPNQQFVNALDGFSTNAVIREEFGGALDPTSFTASSIIIVPVVTDNLTKATTGFLGGTPAPLHPGTDYTAALATDLGVGSQILEITPLHPLLPSTCIGNGQFLGANCKTGTGYLVILTNGIKDTSGNPAVPDTDYAAIKAALAGGPTCPSLTNPTLNGVCQLTGAHLQLAQVLGVNPANVVLTFSFTTESTVDTLELMSATADPTKQTIQVNPTGINTHLVNPQLPGHANVYAGVLTIPYYLSQAAPVTASWQAPPFPLDTTSTNVTRFNPLPVATNAHLMIPVIVTVPNASSLHGATPPAGGWPVLIFQHGITRNREDMFAVADSFADAGFVVAAIDLPLHGITNTRDPFYASAANPLYTGLGLPTTQMSIERTFDLDLNTNAGNTVIPGSPPDGLIDPSGSHAINLTSPLVSRDGLREGVIDLVMLSRLLPSLNLGAAGTVNAGAIHYLGHSLGAIEGTTFMGVVGPGVSTATLANPGGDVPQILITSPSFAPAINAGLAAQGLIPGTTLYANFWRDIQSLWDAGDPVNYIALAAAAHPIHVIQVVGTTPPPAGCNPLLPPNGCPDQVVPNATTQHLIVAGGLTQVHPPGAAGTTPLHVFVNFTAGTHGSVLDPTSSPAATVEMQTEAIAFTLTGGTQLPVSATAPVQ